MFERGGRLTTPRLAELPADAGDAERLALIRRLEELKAQAAAAQARLTADLAASRRAAAGGQWSSEAARSLGAEVALARRESPRRGSRHLGVALAVTAELPHTGAALAEGRLSEWRATVVVAETACLAREQREQVDRRLAELTAPRGGLESLGDGELRRLARRLAYEADAAAVMRRVRGAESDRRVSIRPAPDTMTLVTGLLPVRDGVAVYAALVAEADRLRAAGDARSRGQIMADTFTERLTGRSVATGADIEVGLVLSDRSLLGDPSRDARADAAAEVTGPGLAPVVVPAPLARRLVALDGPAQVWVRRLYADPHSGVLARSESRRRLFAGALRRQVILRDQVCRTPWCDAPVRHVDHVVAAEDGGPTSVGNAQGLCEACNQTKRAAGWSATARADGLVVTETPSGHRYESRPPPLTGTGPPARSAGVAADLRWGPVLDVAAA